MLSPATILHFDSSFRDPIYPDPGHFAVTVESQSNYNNDPVLSKLNSRYAIAGSSVSFYHKWGSNAFNLYDVADIRVNPTWTSALGATLTLKTTSTPLQNSDGGIDLVFDVSVSDHPQMANNYYAGVDITAQIGGKSYTGVVQQYRYSDNRTCTFTITPIGFTETIPVGTSFVLSDPTDTSLGNIFLPGGVAWNNAYSYDYMIFNDTLNEWRPIESYLGNKRLIQVYQTTDPLRPGQPQSQSGLITHWKNNHTYSIRKPNGVPPTMNSNSGAELKNPSPTAITNNTALWFEPKQELTPTSFNLGVAANTSIQAGSFLELMYNPGGKSEDISKVNYQDTLSGGSTITAVLATGPSLYWTQDSYYKGLSMVVDKADYAVGKLLNKLQNTGATTNFVDDEYVVETGINNTYTGTGTGMTFTLKLQAASPDACVSATVVNPGSGYTTGEEIEISLTNLKAITGIATLTAASSPAIKLEITAAAASGGNQGLVRLVTGYDGKSKTVTLATPLPKTLQPGDTVSFQPYANASVVPSIKAYPNGWQSKLVESNQVKSFINEKGTFAETGTTGTTFLKLSGAQLQTDGAYDGFWIAWIHNNACYARLIQTSTFENGVTTVNFKRKLGGVVDSSAVSITLTNKGANYVLGDSTTLVSATSPNGIGGSGLIVKILGVDGGGGITSAEVEAGKGGNHYSTSDIVVLQQAVSDKDATFIVSTLNTTAAENGKEWAICSGKVAAPFSSNLNMQQWLVKSFVRNNTSHFTLNSSYISMQSEVCYEVDLVSLILPNTPLAVGRGGRLAYYPYVIVHLNCIGTSGGASNNLIMSNNRNVWGAAFIAPIDDTTARETATFVKVDGDNAPQVMKFNPNTTLEFKVTLPDGTILKFQDVVEETEPGDPNILGQINAVFTLRRVC